MNRKGINTFRERRSNSIAYWELKSWRCQFFSALNTRNICKLVWPYLSSHRRRAEELAIGNMQFSYLLLSWYLAVPRNTPEKKNENKPKTKTKQKKLSPVPTCLNPELHLTPEQEFFEKFFAWRCSFHLQTQSPSNAQTHIWIKKTERRRWAMPTNKNQQKSTQTHLLFPQGHRGVALTRVSLGSGLSSYTLLFSHRRSMCGASSFKNIKYKTLPYSISNHSIYKFIFSKKKNVKDTVIQHNSSFSFLLWTSLKRNFRSRKESGARLPSRGAPGELTVHQCGVFLPRVTLARTFKCGRSGELCSSEAKWIETSRLSEDRLPQDPAPSDRKFSFSKGTHPTFHVPVFWCPSELQWLRILVSCLKRLRNNSLLLSGSEHICISL